MWSLNLTTGLPITFIADADDFNSTYKEVTGVVSFDTNYSGNANKYENNTLEKVGILNLQNNVLTSFKMTALKDITKSLFYDEDDDVTASAVFENNKKLVTLEFPVLVEIKSGLVFQDNSNLIFNNKSFPELTKVPGDFFFVGASGEVEAFSNAFKTLNNDSFQKLKTVTGQISILSNNSEGHPFAFGDGSFPNLANVTNITINDNDSLTTIGNNSFPLVKTVNGNFTIDDNDQLKINSSFSNLETVNGDFLIVGNNASDIINDSFKNLNTVTGTLQIFNNSELINIKKDFSALKTAGIIEIDTNAKLTSFSEDSFSSLTSVGSIKIKDNVLLTTLNNSFNSLTLVDGDLLISGSPLNITSANFLNLQTVNSNFKIEPIRINDGVVELSFKFGENAFSNLETVNGNFEIETSLDGSSSDELTNFGTSFPGLKTVGGSFEIKRLTKLQTIGDNAFPKLNTVGSDFTIDNNAKLTTLSENSFISLTSVGSIKIKDNALLTTLGNNSFQNLIEVSQVGGEMRIENNNSLTDIGGEEHNAFTKLSTVEGNLLILSNDSLRTFDNFLHELITVNGNLTIISNKVLENIGADAFPKLVTVGDYIDIQTNESLQALGTTSSFNNLKEVGGLVQVITGNSGALVANISDPSFKSIETVGSVSIKTVTTDSRDYLLTKFTDLTVSGTIEIKT